MIRSPAADAPPGTLGTFAGVFMPGILTILGITLFLRLGFLVGSAGLGRGLLIICLSAAIAILTTISLPAVSQTASIVFFPLRYRERSSLLAPKDQISVDNFVKQPPMVALTLAAEDIDVGAGPDEGRLAEVAQAIDTARRAEAEALKAEEEELHLAREARKKLRSGAEPQAGMADESMATTVREVQALSQEAAGTRRGSQKKRRGGRRRGTRVHDGKKIAPETYRSGGPASVRLRR